MKTLKAQFCCLLFFVTCFFASPTFANNIDDRKPVNTVRQQIAQKLQNPNLLANGLQEADLYLQFTVQENGEILLQSINTENEYLIDFARTKLHHQKIELTDINPNTVYHLRIKFELQ